MYLYACCDAVCIALFVENEQQNHGGIYYVPYLMDVFTTGECTKYRYNEDFDKVHIIKDLGLAQDELNYKEIIETARLEFPEYFI